ncbi:hypothetical protein AAFM71_17590 [Chromobacterium violaceum]|uniref:hypothetical protein n=1 Tax=Chromobacterium violaceum TaxID=536 RepID=UPI00385C2175
MIDAPPHPASPSLRLCGALFAALPLAMWGPAWQPRPATFPALALGPGLCLAARLLAAASA